MARNHTRNWHFGRNHGPGLRRGAGESQPSNRRPATRTGSRYTQLEISNKKDQDVIKLFEALTVLKRIKMEEIKPLLLKSATATAMNGLFGKDSEVQWAERLDWQMEYSDLEIRYHELEHKMVTITTAFANENEKNMRILKEREQVLLEQKYEMSGLRRHVELVDEESKLLKALLQDKEMQLQKQKQGRNLNMKYEQLQMNHKDLQRKLDKTENEFQAMVMDKIKVENENKKLRGMLRKTENEFSEQKSEISRLKRRVESMDEETKSLKAQFKKKEIQLLKQKQGRHLNVENKQLELRYKDLQRRFDEIKDDYQSMAMDKTKLENEIKKLKGMVRKTEHEFSEKTSEISRLKKYVESVDEESKSLKEQLQEKEMQLLKQKQGRNLNIENEQLELRHKDLQQKFDKIKDDYQSMAMDKIKLENEIEKLRSTLRQTEQEISEKRNEISRLMKDVESWDKESKSPKIQQQEIEMQLIKQKQERNLNVENEELRIRHKDLQHEFDKIKDYYQSMAMDKTKLENELEKLRSTLRQTEQEFSEKTSEISTLKKRVESVDEETKSLKAQLQEKDIQLQKQKQGRNLSVENEQLELRLKDLQQKFNKIRDEYQSMVMDKTKLENENEKLRGMLRKTEHEFSGQKSELDRLKKLVESVDEESKSLKAQLQEKDIELLKQEQGRNLNFENVQLEVRHKDLQRKFDKIKDEYQSMVMDKTKLENENEHLMIILRKSEQEISEKRNEISRLKKDVESWDKESTSLNTQQQDNEMQLIKQKQERNLNVENEELRIRHKDLQHEFDKIKDDYQSMAMDKTKLENEIEKLRSTLRQTEQEFSEKTSEISRLKKRVESVDEETKSLKEQLQEKEMQVRQLNQRRTWNVEYEQLELRHKDLQRKFDKIKDESQAMIMDKTRLENENEKLSTMLRKSGQESLEQKSEIARLKKRVEKMDQESESFKAHLQEKERQLQEQRLATKKACAEKDDALTRLSRHMGQQMSEGNPNITDLSDQNRPSKLGERYSELYDNEWTDAFEVLTNNFAKDIDDESAIAIMRKILLESYKSVLDFSISQMKEAEDKLSGSSKGVSPECKRLLKEARKRIDIKRADILLETVLEGSLRKVIDRRYLNESMVNVFATECVQLCWFMSIQDPPVVLAEDPVQGSRFDTNMYKHYTNSGDTVDYVVWPALLLHKDGPLLTKGVAQPFPRPSQTST